MKTKAIIIGGSGRVGQALARELATMYETVILITRTQPKVMSENMHVYHVPDFQALSSTIDAISIGSDTDAFSCLGVSKNQVASQDEFYQVNVLYNLEFAKACHKKGVERFFYLSMAGADKPANNLELSAKADVEYYLKSLAFDKLVIFRLNRLTPPKHTFSLKGFGERIKNAKDDVLSVLRLAKVEPLSPKRAAASIALVAYDRHQRMYQDKSKVQIINHQQMCQCTESKKLKRKLTTLTT